MTTLTKAITRMLDHIERGVWSRQDDTLRAAGWEVTRIGRWRRRYRHPLAAYPLSHRRLHAPRQVPPPQAPHLVPTSGSPDTRVTAPCPASAARLATTPGLAARIAAGSLR